MFYKLTSLILHIFLSRLIDFSNAYSGGISSYLNFNLLYKMVIILISNKVNVYYRRPWILRSCAKWKPYTSINHCSPGDDSIHINLSTWDFSCLFPEIIFSFSEPSNSYFPPLGLLPTCWLNFLETWNSFYILLLMSHYKSSSCHGDLPCLISPFWISF